MSRVPHTSEPFLPAGWAEYPFWSVATSKAISGRSDQGLLSVYLDRGVIPYSEGGGLVHKPAESLEKYQLVEPGDLVMNNQQAWRGSLGVSAHRGIVSPAYLVFSLDRLKLHPSFANYMFRSRPYVERFMLASLSVGDIQRQIKWPHLRTIPVLIPSVEEQRTTVRFLDREIARIDGLIQEKTRFIDLLNEKEKAAISHFVRVGIKKEVRLVDSGVEWRGMVPSHWARGRMKNHFRQVKRQGFEHLTVLSVYREYGVIEKASRNDNINKTPEDVSKYQLVEPNDLAINKMKAWQGSMGISSFRGITSPDYVVMAPIGEHDPRYMHHYLRAAPMPWVYRLISNGIRVDQWRMEPEKFLEMPVFLPPLSEQRAIADRIDVELDRLRTLIAKTERSIELLKEKRAALITAAVTGKIDVRTAA